MGKCILQDIPKGRCLKNRTMKKTIFSELTVFYQRGADEIKSTEVAIGGEITENKVFGAVANQVAAKRPKKGLKVLGWRFNRDVVSGAEKRVKGV